MTARQPHKAKNISARPMRAGLPGTCASSPARLGGSGSTMPTDSKPPILPTSVGELQSALTESLEPPADAADSPAASAPTDAAPALPAGEPPELAAIRRDYGEAGVQHVMLEAHRAHL